VKVYIVTTGAAFALLALAHLVRIISEGAHLLREPFFLLSTVIAAAFFAWAIVLLKRMSRPGP